MSVKFESVLARYLITILDAEKQIETLRQKLARIRDFEPYAAFCRIDRDKKKYITVRDLSKFLSDNSVRYSDFNVHYLFRVMDKDRDSAITFEEFLLFILSRDNNELRAIVSQKDTYYISNRDFLAYDVEYCLAQIFEAELSLVEDCYEISIQSKKCMDFNEMYGFRMIDFLDYEVIEEKGLEHFLRKKGYYLSGSELHSLLARLDFDGDCQVRFSDFKELFFLENNQSNSVQVPLKTTLRDGNLNNSLGFKTYKGLNLSNDNSQSIFKSSMKTNFTQGKFYSSNFANISTVPNNQSFKNTFENLNIMSTLNSYTSPKSSNKPNDTKLFSMNSSSDNMKNLSTKLSIQQNISSRNYDNFSYSETNSLIARHLSKVAHLDSALENMKQQLSLKKDFKLNEIFRNFDLSLKGYITKDDLHEALQRLGINIFMKQDLNLVFKRYDLDNDGCLRYTEFEKMLGSNKKEYSKLANSSSFYVGDEQTYLDLSPQTIQLFVKLMEKLVSNEVEIESLRNGLYQNDLFRVNEGFETIKKEFRNYFVEEDIKAFLIQASYFLTENELRLLFQRLDKNSDGKVFFNEFTNEMLPNYC